MIGVASSPNGKARYLGGLFLSGLPTRSMMTLVVSQNAAVFQIRTKLETRLPRNSPSENQARITENTL